VEAMKEEKTLSRKKNWKEKGFIKSKRKETAFHRKECEKRKIIKERNSHDCIMKRKKRIKNLYGEIKKNKILHIKRESERP
jgi:hypothetical protein